MSYEYQPTVDATLSFEKAVTLLRRSISGTVVVGEPEPDRDHSSWIDMMRDRLRNAGLAVEDLVVDVNDWRVYVREAGYNDRYAAYYGTNQFEKSLEHYLIRLLASNPSGYFLDIGAEGSPLAEIVERMDGCRAFRQDIMYAPGVNGRDIGCAMGDIPIENGFFTTIAATCAIEHFEGTADTLFIQEAERLLASGGRVIVVPLYLHHDEAVLTDPLYALAGKPSFDTGAVVHCLEGWGNRHGRYYSPEQLALRLTSQARHLTFQVRVLVNPEEIDNSVYCRFILVGERN